MCGRLEDHEGVVATLRPLRGTGVVSIVAKHDFVTPVAALEGLTALTGLQFTWGHLSGEISHLCRLAQLRRLELHDELEDERMIGNWRQLAVLTKLERLKLMDRAVEEILEVLPALVALTRLELCDFDLPVHTWRCLRGAPQLRHLDLAVEGTSLLEALEHLPALPLLVHLQMMFIEEVPHQLSACTNLTSLDLSENSEMADGWQHLLTLTRLRKLCLYGCDVHEQMPAELAALTGLTNVQLTLADLNNDEGW